MRSWRSESCNVLSKLRTNTTSTQNHNVGSWSSSSTCPTTGACTLTVSADSTVVAAFAPTTHTLTVDPNGPGEVSAAPSPFPASGSISACREGVPASCSASYDEPETVLLTATPAPNSTFAGWSGCEAEPGPTECEVALSEARSVSATFAPILHPLTVSKSGAGQGTIVSSPPGIDCGSTCAHEYQQGSTVALTATPAPGSTFAGFSGACSGIGVCAVTVSAAESVTATFAQVLPPSNRFTLSPVTIKGPTAKLGADVPGPGALLATGKGLKRATANPTAAGGATLALALTAAARKALKHSGHLQVEVAVTYTPTGGLPATLTKAVVFKSPHTRTKHAKRRASR